MISGAFFVQKSHRPNDDFDDFEKVGRHSLTSRLNGKLLFLNWDRGILAISAEELIPEMRSPSDHMVEASELKV